MTRVAFTMRIKPGALAEYKRQHDEIWPELVAEFERQGIRTITIFEREPMLVLYSECADAEAFERLWRTPVHERWGEVMSRLLEWTEEGLVANEPLTEIWHIDVRSSTP